MHKTFEKKNFSNALADKVGLVKQERKMIVGKVFGEHGIITRASDHQDLVDRMPKHKGRKPGQKKRKVCERTSNMTKKKKQRQSTIR